MEAENLADYLETYGPLIGQQIADVCAPLHRPAVDPLATVDLLRNPFPAQHHVITAGIEALNRQRGLLISAECGVGKTLMAQAICQGHAQTAYRAIVLCPPHLVNKWQREIECTLKNVQVKHLRSYHDVAALNPTLKPFGRSWWIVSSTRAKMGPKWRAAYRIGKRMPRKGLVLCPKCDGVVTKKDSKTKLLVPVDPDDLDKKRTNCPLCDEPLWQYTSDIDRWPIATYIHKKLPGFFQYFVADESHQAKSADSAIGQAVGSLAAACDKTIAMTGTLLGGYAWHIRPILYRIAPSTLIAEKLEWDNEMPFNERYGRIERVVTETGNKSSRDNKQSRGKQTRSVKYVRPGVMPSLFGRHLIGNTVFLSLEEVAAHLPPIWEDESVCPGTGPQAVAMDRELAAAYEEVETALTAAVKDMLKQRDKRLLAKMLQTLLGYADHPWGWGEIGYWSANEYGQMEWVHVITPPNLRQDVIYPKEQELIDFCLAERNEGRQVWVYSVMTGERDVNGRLEKLLRDAGLRVDVLRSSVETTDREEWIAERGPKLDVCISHPQLVETGLDLFCKKGRYNFSSLVFYSTGYNTFTMRQAARRAWRIGQKMPCKVTYLHYAASMQARCLNLMSKKLQASQSVEGKFSAEGLAALAGDEGTMEMALAKSLVERLDDLDVGRTWQKYSAAPRELALV